VRITIALMNCVSQQHYYATFTFNSFFYDFLCVFFLASLSRLSSFIFFILIYIITADRLPPEIIAVNFHGRITCKCSWTQSIYWERTTVRCSHKSPLNSNIMKMIIANLAIASYEMNYTLYASNNVFLLIN